MTPIVLFLLMLLAHIIEDFHLQGRMADMKQKAWWYHSIQDAVIDTERRAGRTTDVQDPSFKSFVDMRMEQYGKDYIPILILHGFEWVICVSIPVMIYTGFELSTGYLVMMTAMAFVHAYVDHMKCNKLVFNLVEDQAIHIAQVVVLWAIALVI